MLTPAQTNVLQKFSDDYAAVAEACAKADAAATAKCVAAVADLLNQSMALLEPGVVQRQALMGTLQQAAATLAQHDALERIVFPARVHGTVLAWAEARCLLYAEHAKAWRRIEPQKALRKIENEVVVALAAERECTMSAAEAIFNDWVHGQSGENSARDLFYGLRESVANTASGPVCGPLAGLEKAVTNIRNFPWRLSLQLLRAFASRAGLVAQLAGHPRYKAARNYSDSETDSILSTSA